MKKILVLFVFFSAVMFAQKATPKISAQESEFNFGTVAEGQIVEHNFVVTNKGGENLEITGVGASCGCTAAKPEKNVVKAGESTKINVKFNSTGRRGPQKKYIYVKSNDPEKTELRLLLFGTVGEPDKTTSSQK